MMQLNYVEPSHPTVIVHQMTQLDNSTASRLHNLGIRPGSELTVLRKYPFHGPVIIEFDAQRIGIRYTVFTALLGGD
ncbi:FeoA family protein [Paucilactobacillus nenjiangensis]|uniref:FeoA family protein n=1 Tax=Paucilactobacillus nenjiangensis TaxID=1296540 RepID=UPI0035313201